MKDGPFAMMKAPLRSTCVACALTVLLLVSGCHRHRKSKSAPNTDAYSDNLHKLVEKKALPPEKALIPPRSPICGGRTFLTTNPTL